MHLKMRFQMHLKNAFKRWEIFPKGFLIFHKIKIIFDSKSKIKGFLIFKKSKSI